MSFHDSQGPELFPGPLLLEAYKEISRNTRFALNCPPFPPPRRLILASVLICDLQSLFKFWMFPSQTHMQELTTGFRDGARMIITMLQMKKLNLCVLREFSKLYS